MSDAERWQRWLRQLRSAIVVNWPIKLTALVLSTVLWAAVAAEEPTTQLAPVNVVVHPPRGRSLTEPPSAVQALFAGPARELIKLYGSPPVIRIDVPDTVSGSEFTTELFPANVIIARDIDATVRDVQPRLLTLKLDDVVSRRVSVTPRVTIVPDSGYALVGGIGVTPGFVTIQGPDAAVRRVSEVPTTSLQMTEVTEPVRRAVALDTTGLASIRVTPAEVEVTAEVAPVSERVLMGVPVTVRGERGQWAVDPVAVIVTVRGPSARLARLTRDSLDVLAAPVGGGEPERVPLQGIAPAGLTVTVTPDSATVQRRIRG